MSLPYFDGEVKLESVAKGPKIIRGDHFAVSGVLGQDEGPGGPAEPQARDIRVFVTIWQTKEDTKEEPATEVIARAIGEGKQDSTNPAKWLANMTMQDQTEFKVGCPATGVALTVENSGDPGGFETYTWTNRLEIKDRASGPQP